MIVKVIPLDNGEYVQSMFAENLANAINRILRSQAANDRWRYLHCLRENGRYYGVFEVAPVEEAGKTEAK